MHKKTMQGKWSGKQKMEQAISVLMAVYKNDVADHFAAAVESVMNQSLPPKQVVIVVDGPVPDELKNTIEKSAATYDMIELVWLPENVGTGRAVAIGTEHCRCPYIARMDSDDLAVSTRFEKEMAYFAEHPEVDLVGSNGQEFYDDVTHLAGIKQVPETHAEIIQFIKRRSPFCQQSVIMKKAALIKAGGYRNYLWAEDWDLWIRMYLSGANFYNIQESLVYIRINRETFARRHGLKYYRNIKNILKYMRKHRMLNFAQYTKEKIIRFVGHVLVPVGMKNFFYRKFLRKDPAQNCVDASHGNVSRK